ncbi:unnamed protein product [Hapterophycus canaliculatus]
MNVIQEIKRINERELEQGVSGKASWHYEYKDSAWVFAGGFSYDLTEGDILCVMSQWGEIEDINLCREKDTGKSKGFCFIKYEDQRSTILAVDNFNGIELLGRTIRVDHKHKYSLPAEVRERAEKQDEERIARGEDPLEKGPQWRPGVAYEGKQLATSHNFHAGVDVFAAPDKGSASSDDSDDDGKTLGMSAAVKAERREAKRKRKEARAEARERKKRHKDSAEGASGENSSSHHKKKTKKSKHHKKDKKKDDTKESRRGDSSGSQQNTSKRSNGRASDESGSTRHDHGREKEPPLARDGGADGGGSWERGARAPGDGPTGSGAPFSFSSQPSGRAAASVPPTSRSTGTGNVMDWRGLGGRGSGGRGGGRGGARGGGRGGSEGGGRGGGGRQSGGRGSEGRNSMGGMDRLR